MLGTPRSFVPPFCPNRACNFHRHPRDWRWKRFGFYSRHGRPHRVQRFRCRHCGRTFSTQTFALSYWLRHPELLVPLFHRLLACSGYRQMARELGVHATSLMRLAARLGRHCLLFHQLHRPRGHLTEPVVLDGFESFEYSQYYPLHLHLVVGAASHFLYGFADSELRRKGRMTERQRARRAQLEARLGRPAPGTLVRDVAHALRIAIPDPQPVQIHSDEHPAYPFAMRRLKGWSFDHHCTPATAPRTAMNPLFAVNLADLLLRHNSANHKRETIAFSKRRQGAIERAAVLMVWKNYLKHVSERARQGTPAMRLGLEPRPLAVREVLRRRLFPSRITLPERWLSYYRREIRTRCIPNGTIHHCRYAQ